MFYQDEIGKIYYEYHKCGKANAEVLAFIHGNTLDSTMWIKQVEYFKNSYDILLYDMRGFGKSDVPKGLHSRSRDFVSVVKSLDINQLLLFGVSRGAQVAVDVANIYPNFVSKLIVSDPLITGWNPDTGISKIWQAATKITREKGVEAGKQYWLKSRLFDSLIDNTEAMKILEPILKNYNAWNWLNDEHCIKPELNPTEDMGNIKIPTIIIYGEKDMPEFIECAKFLHDRIKGSKLVEIKGVGHLPNIEKPVEFNVTCKKFLLG
jgi:pimeloyl-ACP methyl ester carboxylesterase